MTLPADTKALMRVNRGATEALARLQAPEHNAAAVSLARLAQGSRRAMLAALNTIADILTSGRGGHNNARHPRHRLKRRSGPTN